MASRVPTLSEPENQPAARSRAPVHSSVATQCLGHPRPSGSCSVPGLSSGMQLARAEGTTCLLQGR